MSTDATNGPQLPHGCSMATSSCCPTRTPRSVKTQYQGGGAPGMLMVSPSAVLSKPATEVPAGALNENPYRSPTACVLEVILPDMVPPGQSIESTASGPPAVVALQPFAGAAAPLGRRHAWTSYVAADAVAS